MPSAATVSRASARPGRRSLDQWARLVDACLRHLGDPVRLRESPLATHTGVGAYARQRYPRHPHGKVLALQDLLCEAVDASLPALPAKKRDFLEQYARGETIAAIARTMGMSRSHLSRVYRPVVCAMVAIALRAAIERISAAPPGSMSPIRLVSPTVDASRKNRGTAHVAELRP
ncbi:MAG: helix-turn-helix transcriptional regulator [Chloroflexi bacterium]|nr:helix-turn-helix transcriptional regulator [Chloroflexota bacterium]